MCAKLLEAIQMLKVWGQLFNSFKKICAVKECRSLYLSLVVMTN